MNQSVLAQTEQILNQLHRDFEWSASDYKQRTVSEIIERRAGNCSDLARVLRAMLEEQGIQVRMMAEINVQPPNPSRQQSAANFVKKDGFSSSVFGLRHNDHRWLEVHDPETGEWFPADSTLNLVGTDAWVLDRLGFGERIKPGVEVFSDMLVPLCVFVVDANKLPLESRTEHYLVHSFDHVFAGQLSKLPSWNTWTTEVLRFSELAYGAFHGTVNLHEHDDLIVTLHSLYQHLREELRVKRNA